MTLISGQWIMYFYIFLITMRHMNVDNRNSDAPNPIRILFASIAVGSGRGQRNSHSLVSSKQITYQNIQAAQC